MADLTLYFDKYVFSHWVLSVWVALEEKGLAFDKVAIDLEKGEARGTSYRAVNWGAKVPALRHGDLVVGESLAILEYLEEAFPKHERLYPEDVKGRAEDRQILSWLRTDLFALRAAMPFEGIFEKKERPPMTEQARLEAEKVVDAVHRRLDARRQKLTLADFELAFTMRRLIHYGYDLSAHQDVVKVSDQVWARSSVQSWNRGRGKF
jgi:glutathione S-transferase